MTISSIHLLGDPVLRNQADEIENPQSPAVRLVADDLQETLRQIFPEHLGATCNPESDTVKNRPAAKGRNECIDTHSGNQNTVDKPVCSPHDENQKCDDRPWDVGCILQGYHYNMNQSNQETDRKIKILG